MKPISLLFFLSLLLQLNAAKKPNVLVIYTDDHRYSGIHALGNMQVKTPNMDHLAENGIVFTHAYLQGAFTGATCVPSRAMLHSGRDLFKLDGNGFNLKPDVVTMGQAFKEAGYYSFHIGKWHQDFNALQRSFNGGEKIMGKPRYLTDHYRMPFSDWDPTGKYKPENCYLLEYDEKGNVKRRALTKDDKRGPTGTEKTGPHSSEVFADEASKFFENYNKEEPFFMYLAFHAPHDPRQAPKKYKKMYPAKKIELTPSYMSQHPFDNGHLFLRDEQLASWPRTPEIAKEELSDYYAIISHLDAQIGRVVKSLKESGLYENTIIILAGDSGLGVGNHGLLGKQNIYDEDGVHVPFIISGGKAPEKGKRLDALCYIHDIMPTACDLAGIDIPETVNGKSMVPVITAEKVQIRDHTYHAYREYQRALRKGDFKLI